MPTEGGLHVPFIIAGPESHVPATLVRDDLVNMLDLSATTLAWAGVEKPDWYEGRNLFDEKQTPRTFVASAKDRLDHTIDCVRTIRTDRFRYTRNYKTDRIFLQPQYRDSRNYVMNLRELYAAGKLSPKLTEIYFGERPAEEFYDVKNDPSQVDNLIDERKYASEIDRHRKLLDAWLAKGDAGEGEESLAELAFQAGDHKWGRAINPEYEAVRQDNDGDGLSDAWERINNRDPLDGRLLFTFDCGGWQTEGWQAVAGELGNIAGRQGYLDFQLADGTGVIERRGLKLDTAKNQGSLVIVLRTLASLTVAIAAAGDTNAMQLLSSVQLAGGGKARKLAIPVTKSRAWSGTLSAIQIRFEGRPGTLIEIDSIAVE